VHGTLSEALIRFIIRTLEVPTALEKFVSLGGTEIICSRLISSHRTQLSPQPGLVAALMNHLKPPQIVNLSSSSNSNSDKVQQTNMEISAGLLNYAPLSTVSSGNPNAQQADALLPPLNNANGNCGGGSSGGGAHRRTRSAAWTHHFCKGENSVDLSVKLPHAVLLHEVQLLPHVSTLSSTSLYEVIKEYRVIFSFSYCSMPQCR
jgi:baculoviral IAP repeat-containing protein 6 (apollon)